MGDVGFEAPTSDLSARKRNANVTYTTDLASSFNRVATSDTGKAHQSHRPIDGERTTVKGSDPGSAGYADPGSRAAAQERGPLFQGNIVCWLCLFLIGAFRRSRLA